MEIEFNDFYKPSNGSYLSLQSDVNKEKLCNSFEATIIL